MIFKPAGWRPEAKRPGIVYLYGGPVLNQHTVEGDNFSPLSYLFQMLMAAKHGYVTINIDPRGQTGYGKRFSEANFQNPGNPQAHKLSRPLLLIHGMMDDNVLYQDTLKMYNAFLGAGKEPLVELFLDPEGKHSLGGTVKYKAVYKKFESWFLRHLGTYGSHQSQDLLSK